MTSIEGCTALITGGASGIGFLMGKLLLEEGAGRLVIWDVSWFDRVAGEWFGIYHSMSTFTGRAR